LLVQKSFVDLAIVQKAMDTFKDDMSKISRDGLGKVLEWLNESDFFTAPASTKYHLSCRYGLLVHSYNVRCYGLKLLNTFKNPHVSAESVVLTSWFHDLCKVNVYEEYGRNTKFEGPPLPNGRFEWAQVGEYKYTEEDPFPMGHGEKSALLLLKFGMKLADSEIAAITHHMGSWHAAGIYEKMQALQNSYNKYPLAILIHTADQFAGYWDDLEMEQKKTNEQLLKELNLI